MQEIWKDIKGYEGYYQISNLGRVRSLDRKVAVSSNPTRNNTARIVKGQMISVNSTWGKGYLTVVLVKSHKYKIFKIHRLIAQAFIPNPQNKPVVNHIDANKHNNSITNLEWVTYSENSKHAYDNNLFQNPTLGKHHSEETKRKIGKANKEKMKGNTHGAKPIKIIYENNTYRFNSLNEMKDFFKNIGITGVKHWFEQGIPKKYKNKISYVGHIKKGSDSMC